MVEPQLALEEQLLRWDDLVVVVGCSVVMDAEELVELCLVSSKTFPKNARHHHQSRRRTRQIRLKSLKNPRRRLIRVRGLRVGSCERILTMRHSNG